MSEMNVFLNPLLKKIPYSLVFQHGDFNRGNRIVPNVRREGEPRLYLLDFDFSAYGVRGRDLGRYFSNYRHHDDMFGDEGFPEDDQELELFLRAYQLESAKLNGDGYLQDPINSLEHLIMESKAYTLQAYLTDAFFGLFMMINQSELEMVVEKFCVSRWGRQCFDVTDQHCFCRLYSRLAILAISG